MSDDFQTVSAKRGDRAREVEGLRARYRQHRQALMGLIADAPTELLAADYRRVIADIDIALARLNDLGGGAPAAPVVPVVDDAGDATMTEYVTEGNDSRSRLLLIGAAALVALVAIGWLIWKASDRSRSGGAVVTETVTDTTATSATVTEDAPAEPVRNARLVTVTPDSVDYGIIRKGTRATRQFEVANNSEEPLSFQVSRSTCRCLFYEHAPVVPPKAKETLTVTIDGARAKPGPLLESLRVSSKSDPSIVATFDVTATVR